MPLGADARSADAPVTAADVDAAIRVAAKVAIDAEEYGRARALLDLRDATPRRATVTALAGVPGRGA